MKPYQLSFPDPSRHDRLFGVLDACERSPLAMPECIDATRADALLLCQRVAKRYGFRGPVDGYAADEAEQALRDAFRRGRNAAATRSWLRMFSGFLGALASLGAVIVLVFVIVAALR